MKELYTSPISEVKEFAKYDVLTLSGGIDDQEVVG